MTIPRPRSGEDIALERLQGDEILGAIEDLARLRIAVFREWPYLYDGDLAYERGYLTAFASAPGAAMVVARDGDRLVGAATAMPLAKAEGAFRAPFEQAGFSLDAIFYFGESVLEPDYRGRGAGSAFFDMREAHARELGAELTTFCSVVRRADDPRCDPGVRSLEPFWEKRGYAPLPGYFARLGWPEIDTGETTEKTMRFWARAL